MKKGAIFDMDGLMFDTERVYQEVWTELADEYGVTLGDSFVREVCGTSEIHGMVILSRYYKTDDPQSLNEECMKRVRRKLEREIPKKPGVEEILRFFRENGVRIAVASSSPQDVIDRYLEMSALADFIDICVSGAYIPNGKPAPDIFLSAAEKLGLSAEDCYVFEDAYNGVRAGHAAGACTIMIPDILPPDPEMEEKADAICDSLFEAMDAIRSGDLG